MLTEGDLASLTLDDVERWCTVDPATGCWLADMPLDEDGYARFGLPSGKRERLHRASWVLATGKSIPDGMEILHSCDIRRCAFPGHLSLGTKSDNMRDAANKGRLVMPPVRSGASSTSAKLTEEQVIAILADQRPHVRVAAEYGVSATTIRNIRSGSSWQ